jgi:hypothetical protein
MNPLKLVTTSKLASSNMQYSVRAPLGGDPQQVRGSINTGHLGAAGVRSL